MSIGGYSSPIRISGLNSGLDTESIVDGLLTGDQYKIDKANQDKQYEEWRLETYNEINSKLLDFSNKYFSILSEDNIISENSFLAYNTNIPENSFFDVTAGGNLIPGNYSVTAATLAQYAKLTGAQGLANYTEVEGNGLNDLAYSEVSSVSIVSSAGDISGSSALKDLTDLFGNSVFSFDEGVATASFNGKGIVFSEDDTLDEALQKINDVAGETGITASFDANKITLNSEKSSMNLDNVVGEFFSSRLGIFEGNEIGAQSGLLTDDMSKTLSQIDTELDGALLEGGQISFSINGENFTFGADSTLTDIVDTVNASGANVNMSIDDKGNMVVRSKIDNTPLNIQNSVGNLFGADSVSGINTGNVTQYATINSGDTIAEAARKMNLDLEAGALEFNINGIDFSFDENTSVSSMISKVNSSNAGVRMSYSDLTKSFIFSTANTGADEKISFSNAGSGTNAFGVGGFFGTDQESGEIYGTNASITINGNTVEQATNSFTIDGMSFELKDDFDVASGDEQVNLSFSQDIQSTVDKVSAFVEEYNEIVEYLDGLVSESKNYDYVPLTDEQKAEMTEDEIENWEEQTKQGLMKNDSAITALLSEMRSSIYSMVGDSEQNAANMGITTNSVDGTISLNTATLTDALNENPMAVANVFTSRSTSIIDSVKYEENGYAVRLSEAMFNYSSDTRDNQIKSTTEAITDIDERIAELIATMQTNEERYWAQFTALEVAMQELNSQQEWLSGQLGSL